MKSKFSSILVLTVICLIAALLLSAANGLTKPIIDKMEADTAKKIRSELLPGATDFTLCDCKLLDGVKDVYAGSNDSGYVITSFASGFGGDITVMTAINREGEIQGIKVTDASGETPGMGAKVAEDSHAEKFIGKSSISMEDKFASNYIEPITGATSSSKAVFQAVSIALEQYKWIGGAH